MTQLPVVTPKQAIKALEKCGFLIRRQSGSHVILFHPKKSGRVVVAIHAKDIKRGTLKNILKQADLSVDEFIELLKQ